MSNWNLKSFDNLHASLAESAYRYRPKKFPYEQLDQIQEERSKLKWEYDNEIDAFYKNQKKLESKDKKISKVVLTVFLVGSRWCCICATVCCCGALVLCSR